MFKEKIKNNNNDNIIKDLKNENGKLKNDIENLKNENLKLKEEIKKIKNILEPIYKKFQKKNSVIMEENEFDFIRKEIETKINKIKKIKKLYQATIDGEEPINFHSKCDNIPYTLTIFKSEGNRRFGGFITQTWDSSSGFKNDEKAFLFSLDKKKFIKLNVMIVLYGVISIMGQFLEEIQEKFLGIVMIYAFVFILLQKKMHILMNFALIRLMNFLGIKRLYLNVEAYKEKYLLKNMKYFKLFFKNYIFLLKFNVLTHNELSAISSILFNYLNII